MGTPSAASDGVARLVIGEKRHEVPLVVGSEGEVALDISRLREGAGCLVLDESLENTASCRSAITFLDGEKGTLRYRGYPVEELAERSTFTEVAYLLLYGELPRREQLAEFSRFLNESSLIHEDMHHLFVGIPKGSAPMGILATMVAALATFYPLPEELSAAEERQILANLISQVRTIAAFSYKKSIGEPVVYPSVSLRYVPNFLTMMFSSSVKDHQLEDDIVRAIDLYLILHADHEQNCSTSTVRIVGSSRTNLYAAISAGIAALWGPQHGGANAEVIRMLTSILESGGDGTEFIARAKDERSPQRIPGFGHLVYRTTDPRARVLKKCCHTLLSKPGMTDPLFDIALRLEELALRDEYFLSRNLYPNVDFYSGLILRAAGIPLNMFTVMFAIGRMPGWLANWREMRHSGKARIVRPRQIYIGQGLRKYQDMRERG